MSVTTATIAVALGQATPTPGTVTAQQWEMWIADAELLIEDRRLELGVDVDVAKLDYVVREAVVAHIKHPDDATQVTVAVDDGSMSRRYESAEGRVTILDRWWAFLGLNSEDSGAYSIHLASSVDTINDWVLGW